MFGWGQKATWPTQVTSPATSGSPPKADLTFERLCPTSVLRLGLW
jgi:hypothetical protein